MLLRFLFLERATEDLTDVRLRKVGAELDTLGHLIIGEVLVEELLQLVFREAWVFLYDENLDHFS